MAVAISKSAEGEFALDTIGLAWRAGRGARRQLARTSPP